MKNKDVFLIVKQYQHGRHSSSVGKCTQFFFTICFIIFCYTDTPDYYYYHADGHRQTGHKRFSTQYCIIIFIYHTRRIRNGHAREPVLIIKSITRLSRL